jgi:hypothetical protein
MLGEFLLVAAVTAAPNIEARVTTPDCTVRIESRIEEGHRPFYRLRPDCALSRRSTAKAVETLQMQAPAQREISIAFGRIVDYPWLSILLAREASAAPGWDAARGRPQKEHPNVFVADLLARLPEFRALFGRRALLTVLVEKVLVAPASELDLPQGAPFPPGARLPLDAQLWVILGPR